MGYASELGNYAEYSGAPKEEEVLQYARVVLDVRTVEPFSCLSILFITSVFHEYVLNLCSALPLILMAVRGSFLSEEVLLTSPMLRQHLMASFGL